jgi:diguanylate cyclase (GGDEF)-like protein
MQKLKDRLSVTNRAIAMVIAAAIAALGFTVVLGVIVFTNTRQLVAAGDRVEQTQDVLSTLQRVSLSVERIQYRTRIYLLSSEQDQLTRAHSAATALQTAAVHIKELVADEPREAQNSQSLMACSNEMTHAVDALSSKSIAPDATVQRCQQVVSLMTDQEQLRLKDNSLGSQRTSFVSQGSELSFVVLSLLTLTLLFVFLLRDAMLRKRLSLESAQANESLAKSVHALEERAHESELLTFSRDELQLCVDVQQIYRSSAQSLSRLLPGTSGALCMINNSRQMVELVSAWGEPPIEDFSPPESCCGLRSGQPRWRQPGVSEIHCMHFTGDAPERYVCLPLSAHGNTLGVLFVQCEDAEGVAAVERATDGLRQLLQLTGMAVASLNLRTKLENQSIRDGLTGLFNRHFMQISLERELSRASRRKQGLAVLMLDLDHFKRFNDSYGHAAGDLALKGVADIFRSSVRAEDIACRYGGEEFTIILPDVTQELASERAENIRRAVAGLHVPLEKEEFGEFTVSIGVALFPRDGGTAEALLRRADQALYRAKRQGRDQVVLHDSAALVG